MQCGAPRWTSNSGVSPDVHIVGIVAS